MTDREMLELAAKAAGYNYSWSERYECAEIWSDGDKVKKFWQPHVDDGDALRLTVKLGLGISFGQYAPLDIYSVYISKVEGGDELAVGCISDGDEFGVVRLAITRAAAAIGREMQ